MPGSLLWLESLVLRRWACNFPRRIVVLLILPMFISPFFPTISLLSFWFLTFYPLRSATFFLITSIPFTTATTLPSFLLFGLLIFVLPSPIVVLLIWPWLTSLGFVILLGPFLLLSLTLISVSFVRFILNFLRLFTVSVRFIWLSVPVLWFVISLWLVFGPLIKFFFSFFFFRGKLFFPGNIDGFTLSFDQQTVLYHNNVS